MFHIMHTSDNKLCANITQYQIEDGDNGMLFLSRIKKNNIALVVGTGESVNSINYIQSHILMNIADIWGLNHFFFHDYIIPLVYHVEMASLGKYGNTLLWNYFRKYKKHLYNSTTFITPSSMKHNLENTLCHDPLPRAILSYTLKDYFADHAGCTQERVSTLSRRNMFTNTNNVDSYCSATITRVIGLLIRLRYKHIAFIGVDLTSTTHFYSHHPYLKGNTKKFETMIRNKDIKRYNSSIHATGARGVHLLINRAAQIFTNIEFYNMAPTSKLANMSHITTLTIDRFIRKYYIS